MDTKGKIIVVVLLMAALGGVFGCTASAPSVKTEGQTSKTGSESLTREQANEQIDYDETELQKDLRNENVYQEIRSE